MQRRDLHMVETKLKNLRDKREVVLRERKLLQERIDSIITSIGQEVEARKGLRKEVKEMNEAFRWVGISY